MAQLSGQVVLSDTTVTQLPDIDLITVALKAHPNNTDTIWVGNDGNNTVAAINGFPLNAGETVVLSLNGNLSVLYAIADVDTERLCWAILN